MKVINIEICFEVLNSELGAYRLVLRNGKQV